MNLEQSRDAKARTDWSDRTGQSTNKTSVYNKNNDNTITAKTKNAYHRSDQAGWIGQLASADNLAPRTKLTALDETGLAMVCLDTDILNIFRLTGCSHKCKCTNR